MTDLDRRQLVLDLFSRLRLSGFSLGIGELLCALHALEGGWGSESLESLQQTMKRLWCKSAEEDREFEITWDRTLALLSSPGDGAGDLEEAARAPRSERELSPAEEPQAIPPELSGAQPAARERSADWQALPVQAAFSPVLLDERADFHTYGPVTRRSMIYAWRYLRRPIADGPEEILDVKATVDRAAREGFFLAPVCRRREQNYAHLVLLLDQGGSMVPFHRLTRDVTETALHESGIRQVDAYYFHNLLADSVYLDSRRTLPVELERALAACTDASSLLIVSDAGAARGPGRPSRLRRIRDTAEFLSRLKEYTLLIAWLNPMPASRWPGTAAQSIARFVPMFPLDADGLSNAVDTLRGQPLSHYR